MNTKYKQPHCVFKILLIGDSSVGKTRLMLRFADNSYTESLKPTIGVDFKSKLVTICEKTISLQLWDTAGQEKFFNITRSYYRNADAIVLVYDRTDAGSFRSIARWMRNIDENASETVMRILVGNKSDLHDRLVISTQQGQALADQFQIDFFETSAKSQTSPSVANMFHFLAGKLLIEKQRQQEPISDREKSTVDVSDKSAMSSFSSCCYSTSTPKK